MSAPIQGFLFGAGQKSDVLAERNRDPGHDDLAVAIVVQRLREPRGEREQRLAGARRSEHGHEVDLRIHQ
jgi:hypothetical protein